MSDTIRRLIVVLVLVGVGAAGYYWLRPAERGAPLPVPAPLPPASGQNPPAKPAVQFPVPEAQNQPPPQAAPPPAKPKPLPPLDDSDRELREVLAGVIGKEQLDALFNFKNFIRRVVVTIDNEPGKQLPQRYLPVKTADGRFRVAGPEDNQYISPDNYLRYTPYVRVAQALDTGKVVAVYTHFYPLFQQAYRDLGYPGYFNDRLIQVIDNLLATPQVRGPVKVVQPSVYYKYADPKLEALSAGQKILIRMGPDNADRIKNKLRRLRQALTHLDPKGP